VHNHWFGVTEDAAMRRRVLRTLLLVIGVACLVVFFSVNRESGQAAGESTTRWAIGLNISPWFVSERGPSGFRTAVELFSASWLFAAAAVGAFWCRARLTASVEPATAPDLGGKS
jgi:hypothetical protein